MRLTVPLSLWCLLLRLVSVVVVVLLCCFSSSGHRVTSAFCLSIAIYLDVYPVFLLVPVALLIHDQHDREAHLNTTEGNQTDTQTLVTKSPQLRQPESGAFPYLSLLSTCVLTLAWLAVWLCASYVVMG